MPLVSCPVCEKQISKRAHACPGCGEPDPLHHLPNQNLCRWCFGYWCWLEQRMQHGSMFCLWSLNHCAISSIQTVVG